MEQNHRTPRRLGGWLAAAVLVAMFAGCGTVTYNVDTGEATSDAERTVVATTVPVDGVVTDAVEVKVRWCETLRLEGLPDGPQEHDLRTYASVVDGEGELVYSNLHIGGFVPGSAVTDSDGLDTIKVPVEGRPTPLTITAGCTTYAGIGSGPFSSWVFDSCETATRTCATTSDGEFVQY